MLAQLAELAADAESAAASYLRRAQLLEKEGSPAEALGAYRAAAGAGRPGDRRASRAWSACWRRRGSGWRRPACSSRATGASTTPGSWWRCWRCCCPPPTPEQRLERMLTRDRRAARGAWARSRWPSPRGCAPSPSTRTADERPRRAGAARGRLGLLRRGGGGLRGPARARRRRGPRRDELWRRLAAIYGERLKRSTWRCARWRRSARRDPYNRDVLEALARIYRPRRALTNLALVMRRQVAAEPNATRAGEPALRAGRTWRRRRCRTRRSPRRPTGRSSSAAGRRQRDQVAGAGAHARCER